MKQVAGRSSTVGVCLSCKYPSILYYYIWSTSGTTGSGVYDIHLRAHLSLRCFDTLT